MEKAAGSGGGWGRAVPAALPLDARAQPGRAGASLGLPLSGSTGRRAGIPGLQLHPAETPGSRKQPCSGRLSSLQKLLSPHLRIVAALERVSETATVSGGQLSF